jgi:hypothetical protein
MVFMPFHFLLIWLVGLLSISILGGGLYILYEWYIGELVGMSYFVGGLGMIVWSFGGRFISLPLFRRARRDEPKRIRSETVRGMLTLTFCRLFPEQLGSRVAGLILVDTTSTNPVKTAMGSKVLRAVQKPLLEPLLYLTIGLSPLLWLMTWLSYICDFKARWTHEFKRTESGIC